MGNTTRRKRKQQNKRKHKKNDVIKNKRMFYNEYVYLFLMSMIIISFQQIHLHKKKLSRKSEFLKRCSTRCDITKSKPTLENTRSAISTIISIRNGNIVQSQSSSHNNSDLRSYITKVVQQHHTTIPIIFYKLWFEGITSHSEEDDQRKENNRILSSSTKGLYRMKTMNDNWESSLRWIVNWSSNDSWKSKSNRYVSRKEKVCKETCMNTIEKEEPSKKEISDLFWSGISFLIGCSYIHAISMYGSKVWLWHDSIVFIFQVVSCTLWLAFIKFIFHYLSCGEKNRQSSSGDNLKCSDSSPCVKEKKAMEPIIPIATADERSNRKILKSRDIITTRNVPISSPSKAIQTKNNHDDEIAPIPTVVSSQSSQEEDSESFSSSLTDPSIKSIPEDKSCEKKPIKPRTIVARPTKSNRSVKINNNNALSSNTPLVLPSPTERQREEALRLLREYQSDAKYSSSYQRYNNNSSSSSSSSSLPTMKQRDEALRLLREYQSAQISKIIKGRSSQNENNYAQVASFSKDWQLPEKSYHQEEIKNNDDYSFSDELLLSNMLDDDDDEKDDLSNSTISQPNALTTSPVLTGVSSSTGSSSIWGTTGFISSNPWMNGCNNKNDREFELWSQSTLATASIAS